MNQNPGAHGCPKCFILFPLKQQHQGNPPPPPGECPRPHPAFELRRGVQTPTRCGGRGAAPRARGCCPVPWHLPPGHQPKRCPWPEASPATSRCDRSTQGTALGHRAPRSPLPGSAALSTAARVAGAGASPPPAARPRHLQPPGRLLRPRSSGQPAFRHLHRPRSAAFLCSRLVSRGGRARDPLLSSCPERADAHGHPSHRPLLPTSHSPGSRRGEGRWEAPPEFPRLSPHPRATEHKFASALAQQNNHTGNKDN